MGRPDAQRRRRRRLLAGLATGVAIAILAFGVPAAAAGGTTITGRVEFDGRPVAGATVHFDGVGVGQGRTTTRSDGSFALPTSQEALGHVVVGGDGGSATWTSGSRAFLRAVVGATRPAGGFGVLLEEAPPAKPARIAEGGRLLIHLREAGRLTGAAPQLAVRERVADPYGVAGRTVLQRAVIRVLRRDGSEVDGDDQRIEADAQGRFTTFPLAPGAYRLEYLPKGPVLPVTVDAVVRSGTTEVTVPAFGAGGSIAGTVSTATASTLHLRVELRRGDAVVARTRTESGGAYRFDGLAAGGYTVHVPGFGTDSNVPRDPVDRDAVLGALTVGQADAQVAVPTGSGTVRADLALPEAATIEGTVPAGRVVALEDLSGNRLRSDVASGLARSVRFGGLTPGRYRLIEGVVGRIGAGALAGATVVQRYGVREVALEAGQRLPLPVIAATRPAITVSGALRTGRTSPEVGSPVFLRLGDDPLGTVTGVVDRSHHYTVPGLLPGRWTFRSPAVSDTLLLTGSTTTAGHDVASTAVGLVVQGRTADGAVVLVAPRAESATGGPAPRATSRLVEYGRGSTATPVVAGPPGAYRWVEGPDDPAPVVDGPWWYAAVDPTFTIPAEPTRPLVLDLAVRS